MINPYLFQGERIRLTALKHEDLGIVARWQEDSEYLRSFDARPAYPRTEPKLKEWLDKVQEDDTAYVFAIRLSDSDELIGYIEIDGILWAHGTGWLSIGVGDRAYWSQGYGTEAAALALRFAFDELNLYRLQATIFAYNERSLSLFDKLGFEQEGIFREFVCRDGRRYDMVLFGLLRSEWLALEEAGNVS